MRKVIVIGSGPAAAGCVLGLLRQDGLELTGVSLLDELTPLNAQGKARIAELKMRAIKSSRSDARVAASCTRRICRATTQQPTVIRPRCLGPAPPPPQKAAEEDHPKQENQHQDRYRSEHAVRH